MARMQAMASATPTAKTPSPIARRCAPIAPATAVTPQVLTLDTSLRPGDVVATTDGLVAYSGVRTGTGLTAEFTPVASYPGLTAETRARLGEMKVAPVAAEMVASEMPLPEVSRNVALPTAPAPKAASPRARSAKVEAGFASDRALND